MSAATIARMGWVGKDAGRPYNPAMSIGQPVRRKEDGRLLRGQGLERVRVETRLSPAWTTDWMSEAGKQKLKGYGIAPQRSNRPFGVDERSRPGHAAGARRPPRWQSRRSLPCHWRSFAVWTAPAFHHIPETKGAPEWPV